MRTRWILLITLLLTAARAVLAQASVPSPLTGADMLRGAGAPLTLTVKDLGPGWLTFTPSGLRSPLADLLASSHLPGTEGDTGPQSYVTRGEMVTLGTGQYLLAYAIQDPGLQADPKYAGFYIPAPITPDTPLVAALLDLATVGSLLDVAPFTPAWVSTVNTQRSYLTDIANKAARQARESTLKANLQRIRSAVSHFQADTGIYPARLEDVVAPATTGSKAGSTDVAPNSYKGPYLTTKGGIGGKGLLMNPFAATDDTTVAHHWTYTPADGNVTSAVEGVTSDGQKYTEL
jgi:hypothetical protein